MKRWSGLFQRGAISITAVETGKTSFVQSSWKLINFIQVQRLGGGNILELKKKTRPLRQHHFSLSGDFWLSNHLQIFYQKWLMCILSSSLETPHLHSPQLRILRKLPILKQGDFIRGCRFHNLWSTFHKLENLALPATSRRGRNTMSKVMGVDILSAFKGGGGAVEWDSLVAWAVSSLMGKCQPVFHPSLMNCFKVLLLHIRHPGCTCGCSGHMIGGALLSVHVAVVNVVIHHLFIFSHSFCLFPFAFTFNALELHLAHKASVFNPCLRLCILGSRVLNA